MTAASEPFSLSALDAFVDLVGLRAWRGRLAAIEQAVAQGQRQGQAALRRHSVEVTIERLRRHALRAPGPAERRTAAMVAGALATHRGLSRIGRHRMRAALRAALAPGGTLMPLFHLLRTAEMQHQRGFDVRFAGFEDATPFDLLLSRDGVEAELACDTVSAEEGRDVRQGAWLRLVDRIDPALQSWLAANPGRYLLKLTLPQGLREDGGEGLATLQWRIAMLLEGRRRADHDAAAVLRLDPLMLAGAEADALGLMASLRREFGHEAHLAVTTSGRGVFALAARAGRENEVAGAIRRRMMAVAPARLSGRRPGILAMFVEDTDRLEWRHLRERLELEGEARQFLTLPEARWVVAVTCASRLELFGAAEPDAAPGGELRFRNPAHPAARTAALAPAVLSSV